MTKAKFIYEKNKFKTFTISGHAYYADEGLDIVCAGISATVITSLNLLMKLLKGKFSFTEKQEEGFMNFEITSNDIDLNTREFVDLVVSNLYESLNEISETYPNHLKVKIEK